jgi:hypothetical protein
MPLMQFTCPSEYVSGRGIVVWVGRSPLGLRRDDGTLGVFPCPPAKRISQCANASLVDFALLQGAFPNRTAGLASDCSLDLRRALACDSASYSHGVLPPSSASNVGSDQHRGCLPQLCGAFGLSQTLDALLHPRLDIFRHRNPSCQPCFMLTTLMGFLLQRFPFPMARLASRPRCPSRRPRTVVTEQALRPRFSPSIAEALSRPQGFGYHQESVLPVRGR